MCGPAGSGKSTLSRHLLSLSAQQKRTFHLFNLDPAVTDSQASIDITNLISLEDAMTELQLGPNGALIYCLEYLLDNLDWLSDQVGDFPHDYLLIDCPGTKKYALLMIHSNL